MTVISPLHWTSWAEGLAKHPDREFADYLVQGIRDGFRIGFDYANHSCKRASRNMSSALERPEVVRDYLAGWGGFSDPSTRGCIPQCRLAGSGSSPKVTQANSAS